MSDVPRLAFILRVMKHFNCNEKIAEKIIESFRLRGENEILEQMVTFGGVIDVR